MKRRDITWGNQKSSEVDLHDRFPRAPMTVLRRPVSGVGDIYFLNANKIMPTLVYVI